MPKQYPFNNYLDIEKDIWYLSCMIGYRLKTKNQNLRIKKSNPGRPMSNQHTNLPGHIFL